ncbi:TetR/AcrR family transcriptional regulator [Paraburkholderia sp. MM6662-R1]|uniref:TetR/AcrR family transcriptional regulator n=1 Tax=Paraburkholderia sp. MM6662-R1 TaxID=2991066 RepID=UPI003D23F498
MASARTEDSRPVGLRERNKAKTQEKILSSARALFARNGYPATSMEAIAAAANLSATTLYNYFGTKGQILLAMIARSDAEMMASEQPAPSIGDGSADHISAFLSRLTRHSLKRIDRGTWRYAIAHSMISENADDIKDEYSQINGRLVAYIVSMLEMLNARNRLPPVQGVATLGQMIFDMYHVLFIRLISSDALSVQEHEETLHRYVSAAIGAQPTHNKPPAKLFSKSTTEG